MATNDIPVLCLWKTSLYQDLLWMRLERLVEGVDPISPYLPNIPSWTWLCCPYAISHDFWGWDEDEPGVDIQDYLNLVESEVA
jgi:hypothetical protein